VIPLTFQVTVVFEVFVTVAAKALVRLIRTVALVGEIVTLTGCEAGVMVTEAVPTADASSWLCAWIVTVAGEGTLAGAV
jgi:hypothetical protein